MNRRPVSLVATLCFTTFTSASSEQLVTDAMPSDSIVVSLQQVDDTNIRIEYPVLGSCTLLRFEDNRESVHCWLRKTWALAADSCGQLTKEGIATKGCQPGQRIALEIPNTVTRLDRIYPPATPLKGVGTLVHTGALVTDGSCGEQAIEFRPPKERSSRYSWCGVTVSREHEFQKR